MLLWIIFAVMTAATLAVVLRPLFRPAVGLEPAAATENYDPDIAVYRDQLSEIDADIARGVIEPADAEVARREISRRLLRAADGSNSAPATPPASVTMPNAAFVLAAAIPVCVLAGYLWLGSPGVPSAPYAAPAASTLAKASIDELLARVEKRLAENPNEGQGWDVIAPVYLRMDRFDDAAAAFTNAIRILGESPQRLAGFAEATVLAKNGIVTEPARKAYEKLAALEPGRPEPKFWLLMAKEQDGKKDEAIAGYRQMLAEAPADAEWKPLISQRLAALTGTPPPASAAKSAGPSAADIEAASKMSNEDRGKMIADMIDGLAARLKSDGKDPAGWVRLVNAYVVLGQREKAVAAVADARAALAGVENGDAALRDIDAIVSRMPRDGKDRQ